MPVVARFTVQGYVHGRDGDLVADEPIRCESPEEAREKAAALAERKAGIVAYWWNGDMRTGEEGRIRLLMHDGELPLYAALALGIEN